MSAIAVMCRIPRSAAPVDQFLREKRSRLVLFSSTEVAATYATHLPEVHGYDEFDVDNRVVEDLARLCRTQTIERIVHATEADLLRAAWVRDQFGVPGPTTSQILPFRDKVEMKRRARSAGIAVADFTVLDNPVEDFRSFAAGRPAVVIKPRDGAASRDVSVHRTGDIPEPQLSDMRPGVMMLEEFIDAPMAHVDGFATAGRIEVAVPAIYLQGCLAFQRSKPLLSAQLDPNGEPGRSCIQAAERVLACMPHLERSPFHLELFLTDKDPVLCEVAARVGGGLIPHLLGTGLGIHPAKVTFRDQARLPVDPLCWSYQDGLLRGFVMIPPKSGVLLSIDPAPRYPWIEQMHVHRSLPAEIANAHLSTDCLLSFICHADDHDLLAQRLRYCAEIGSSLLHWKDDDGRP